MRQRALSITTTKCTREEATDPSSNTDSAATHTRDEEIYDNNSKVTITNGSVVALGGGYVTPHATLRAALRRLYPLDCDAGPMNGDNNIIQLPKDKGL